MSQYDRVQDHRSSSTVPTVPPGHPPTGYNPVRDHRGSSVRDQPPQSHQQMTDSRSVGILRGPPVIPPLPRQSRPPSPPWPVEIPRLRANFTNKLKRDKPQSTITQGSLQEILQSGSESRAAARNQAGPLIQSLNNYEPQHNSLTYVNRTEMGLHFRVHLVRSPMLPRCTVPPFANREDLFKHMTSKHLGTTKARKHSNEYYMNSPLGGSRLRGAK
ncbi:hypothetical protein BDZ89DRAFT_1150096 [Hymenopellis radicata]|nr:hypothetical protein BDZ89DRAFT_1150096 [Hymenopellis radicata]